MSDRTVIVDGFSKGYSMTGWRLGYGVMPVSLTDAMTTLIINNVSCTATFVQYAGIAALTGPQDAVTRMVAGLRTKRDLLVRGLNAIDGISCASPAGAFYCFPDISGVLERTGGGATCKSFAERLLAEQHVAVLAGTAVGPGGGGHPPVCHSTPPAAAPSAPPRRPRSASSVSDRSTRCTSRAAHCRTARPSPAGRPRSGATRSGCRSTAIRCGRSTPGSRRWSTLRRWHGASASRAC